MQCSPPARGNFRPRATGDTVFPMEAMEDMEADDVSRMFSPVILARGEAYLRDGRVRSVTRIAPGLFHGEVEGGELYDVSVRVPDDGAYRLVACSCPFAAKGNHCKHEAAVMLAIADGGGAASDVIFSDGVKANAEVISDVIKSSESVPDEPGPMLTDIYDDLHPRLAAWYGEHGPLLVWDATVADDCESLLYELREGHATKSSSFPVLSERQAGRMAESFIQSFLESDSDDDDYDNAFIGANDVLDNALSTLDHAAAVRNALVVMRIMEDSLDYLGDCEGNVEDCVERLVWKIRMLTERIVDDEQADSAACKTLTDGIVGLVLDDPCGLREDLGSALLSFSSRRRTRMLADAALSKLERAIAGMDAIRRRSYWRSYWCRLRHDDLLLAGEYARAEQFESDNADDNMMAWIMTVRLLLDDDYDHAWETVCRHMAQTTDPWAPPPNSSLPCGWPELSVAIAQRRGDREASERLYVWLIADCCGDGALGNDTNRKDTARWARRLHKLAGNRRWHSHMLPAIAKLRRARAAQVASERDEP